MSKKLIMSTKAESNLQLSYLSNGTWKAFSDQIQSAMDGIKIQTRSNNSYYLQYRTWNQGKSGYYPYVKSNENDYAGSSGKPIQRLQIQAYQNDGTKLTENVVVMYRAYINGEWLPWVSNADPEWMRSVHSKYNLDGTLDTASSYAGKSGENISGIEIRVYEEDSLDDGMDDFSGDELNLSLSYMADSTSNWNSLNRSTVASHIDGINIQTGTNKPYYLSYKTWNYGQNSYYPAIKSTDNDYAGSAGKPIQRLSIQAYKNNGTKLTSGVIVMYRAYVNGEWLPWVSNADPAWMRNIQNKYSLGGTLDTKGAFAGISGKNISGVEIRIFEDDSLDAGMDDFSGDELNLSLSYMADSNDNWNNFSKSATSTHIDGIQIQTDSNQPFYLLYKTLNAGRDTYYPEVSSIQNDYAGSAGKPIQRLSIHVYRNDGTKLTSGVVVMYRALVDGKWLPWVSNANPEWMRSVQSTYNLGGTLDTSGSYAGLSGKNISGIEIRAFKGDTNAPIEDLPGDEAAPSLSYMFDSDSNWHSFDGSVMSEHIDGIKIHTSSNKQYYINYKTWNAGKSYYYPDVTSAQDDYAGSPGKPIQRLSIHVYRNDGTKLTSGVVVMYRALVDGKWLPWVSNADPEWMRSVQSKYDLGGALDTSSSYAGIADKNISGIEIRVFEENNANIVPTTPTGDYKIIQAQFISQLGKYPTGCESVTAAMALNYAGVNISVDKFIDTYLNKSGIPFDPNLTFGGNPRSVYSYGCYSPVIKNALDRALSGKNYTAKILNNIPLETLCSKYIDKEIPVIMWATMYMNPPYIGSTWTFNGKTIQWVAPEHCLLLVGYDDNNYIFNDPMQTQALTYYSKSSVEAAYKGLFSQAVVILADSTPTEPIIDVAELERIDRNTLMNTYYYAPYYNALNTRSADVDIPSNFNDYNILACLQLLYIYFWDQKDYEKTDMLYDEMLTLRKLNPSYKTIYADFLNASGEFEMGYQYYAPGRKTTKLHFEAATYFTVDTIRQMHQCDDWMIFMASLIPGAGQILSPMMETMRTIEQNGGIGISDSIVEGVEITVEKFFEELMKHLEAPEYVATALNTFVNFTNTAYSTATEDRETYVRDGVTLQDGDSYMQVRLYYDMGVEYHDFRFYFRNGYPLVTNLEQFIVRWDDDNRGKEIAARNAEEYAKNGYVPSEIHKFRGSYWPLK